MPASLSEIEQQAALLPAEQRAKLAEFLLESLQDPSSAEIAQAWEQEITRRVSAFEAGMATVPAHEVFAEIKRLTQ